METPMNRSPPLILPNPTVDKGQELDQLDTLSLRDLPTAVDLPPQNNHSRRSSSASSSDPTSDFFFEFLINNDDDLITSSADDVIFHGRLLPYAPPHRSRPRRSLSLSSRLTRREFTPSNSDDSLPSSIRPSKSLNYRKLHRNHHHHHHHRSNSNSNSKPKSEHILKNSCANSCNNNNNNNSEKLMNTTTAKSQSPWYWLIFGLPKIPAEMELKDMKNRQYRRNITTAKKAFSGEKSCGSSSSASWRFLNVLSCKSHATVDVYHTPPFRTTSLM